jgi:hypothetical protein
MRDGDLVKVVVDTRRWLSEEREGELNTTNLPPLELQHMLYSKTELQLHENCNTIAPNHRKFRHFELQHNDKKFRHFELQHNENLDILNCNTMKI